jgi:hypothetical protein
MPEAVIEEIIAAVVVKYTMISSVEKDFFWRRNCECEIPADLADHQKDSSSIPFGKTWEESLNVSAGFIGLTYCF